MSAEAIARIRARREEEAQEIRALLEQVLRERGEVCAPDVRERIEQRRGGIDDRSERYRIMKRIRAELLSQEALGKIELREVRSSGRSGLLRHYYARARS